MWFMKEIEGNGNRVMERLDEGQIVEGFKCDNRMNLFCSSQRVISHLEENNLIRVMS